MLKSASKIRMVWDTISFFTRINSFFRSTAIYSAAIYLDSQIISNEWCSLLRELHQETLHPIILQITARRVVSNEVSVLSILSEPEFLLASHTVAILFPPVGSRMLSSQK